jgi:hypothetical protein
MDLTDMYRLFQPTAMEYIFFSATHGTFSKTDLILRHEASLNKHKNIKISSYILSDDNGIKPEVKSKKNYRKYPNMRLNNAPLNNKWIINKIREETKNFQESSENENAIY